MTKTRVPGGHRRFIAIALATVGLLLPGHALAAPGDPDQTFGVGGRLATGVGSVSTGIAIDSMGRIVVSYRTNSSSGGPASGGGVLRLTPEGALDPSFSGDGVSEIPSLTNTYALAVDQLDRVVVAGYHYNGSTASNTRVYRLTSSGDPDTTFAGGVRDLGARVRVPAVEARPDGRVLLATVDPAVLYAEGGAPTSEYLVLHQLTTTGADDAAFGNDGVALLHTGDGSTTSQVFDVGLSEDGQAAVLGGFVSGGSYSTVVARVGANGEIDSSFDGGGAFPSGLVPLDRTWAIGAIATDGSGRVLVGGGMNGRGTVGRLTPEGQPDATFGTDGLAVVSRQTPGFGGDIFDLVSVLPSGKLILSSVTYSPDLPAHFFATQLTESGVPDPGYGQAGSIDFDTSAYSSAATDGAGRVVMAGSVNGVLVQRFEGDPVPDPPDSNAGGVAGEAAASGPGIQVHSVRVPKSLRKLLARGVRVEASCELDCRMVVELHVTQAVANRMRLGATIVGRAEVSAAAGESKTLVAKINRSARGAIRAFDGRAKLKVIVTGEAP